MLREQYLYKIASLSHRRGQRQISELSRARAPEPYSLVPNTYKCHFFTMDAMRDVNACCLVSKRMPQYRSSQIRVQLEHEQYQAEQSKYQFVESRERLQNRTLV